MARPKATAESTQTTGKDEFDEKIRGMIVAMAKAVSTDLNQYQIQASILTRLAKWASKRVGDAVMCPEWETKYLPKYITYVAEVSREQHQRIAAFMASKQKDARKEFQDAALILPIGKIG